MTICVTLNGKVINVGPWDYQYRESSVDDLSKPVRNVHDEIIGYEKKAGGVVPGNPMPPGAITEDVPLAWTTDERIVLASDPSAVTPYVPPEDLAG